VNGLDPAILTTTGLIARLAYQRGQAAGVELELLLKKAGLTKQQVEDVDIRLSVDCQIRFLNLAARALQDEFLGFHLCQENAFRRWTGKTPREARLARGTPNTGTYPANQ
jgi:hypothetical protein